MYIKDAVNNIDLTITLNSTAVDASWTPNGNIACAIATEPKYTVFIMKEFRKVIAPFQSSTAGYFSFSRKNILFSTGQSVMALYKIEESWVKETFQAIDSGHSIIVQVVKVEINFTVEYWAIELIEPDTYLLYLYYKQESDVFKKVLLLNSSYPVSSCRHLSYDSDKYIFCLPPNMGKDVYILSVIDKTVKLHLRLRNLVEVTAVDFANLLLYTGLNNGMVDVYNLTQLYSQET